MWTTLSDTCDDRQRRRALLRLAALTGAVVVPAAAVAAQPTAVPRPAGDGAEVSPRQQPVIEVAAFRVAPVAQGAHDARARTATSRAPALAIPPGGERVHEARVQKGERWEDLLRRVAAVLSVAPSDAITPAAAAALPPLAAGKYLRARATAADALDIDYVVSADEAYGVTLNAVTLNARALPGDPRLIERMRADPAKASLFTATDTVGLPEAIALQLTDIFAGEVDFLRELHLGYRCALAYEAQYREGFIEPAGRILAAEFDVGKRSLHAYHSPDTRGQSMYFDASGKTTRRFFRRSPLEFTRVTSDYTLARFHPILGVWTAHRGVDYAAPAGTKIMSVADGVVTFAGAQGGYGNLVIVRHQEKYQTYYAHMSAFAPTLAVGNKVSQGETLGFVGMTGLATGPHLHFEFHVRNSAGEWESVPAPEVIDTTFVAASGFARRIQTYRDWLAVADQHKLLIL